MEFPLNELMTLILAYVFPLSHCSIRGELHHGDIISQAGVMYAVEGCGVREVRGASCDNKWPYVIHEGKPKELSCMLVGLGVECS